MGEVADDRGVDEAGRDAGKAEVIRDGSTSVVVVRDGAEWMTVESWMSWPAGRWMAVAVVLGWAESMAASPR